MVRLWFLGTFALLLAGQAGATPARPLCGWWVNPTPGNVTLLDGRDEYEIARQGAGQAAGAWPRFTAGQWVGHGSGAYGHGCVCLDAVVDDERIPRFDHAVAQPLARCRHSPRLRRAERDAG